MLLTQGLTASSNCERFVSHEYTFLISGCLDARYALSIQHASKSISPVADFNGADGPSFSRRAIVLPTYASNPSSHRNVPFRWTTSPSTSIRESALTSVIMSTWTALSLPDSPSGRQAS